MSYLTRDHALDALVSMRKFYFNLCELYSNAGMNLSGNLGRRNILMSEPMEHFLAQALRSSYDQVDNDGRTGKADIVIQLDYGPHELECKLTSPHTSGAIAFQSDYETLEKKGKLDYVYILANAKFEGFVVVYFKDLTIDDFHPLANGARGKVQMAKHRGMKKATVLVGKANSSVENQLEKNQSSISKAILNAREKMKTWEGKIKNGISEKEEQKLLAQSDRVITKLFDQIENLIVKQKAIKVKKPRYTFEYEMVE